MVGVGIMEKKSSDDPSKQCESSECCSNFGPCNGPLLYTLFSLCILRAVWINHLILVYTTLHLTSFEQEHNHFVLGPMYLPRKNGSRPLLWCGSTSAMKFDALIKTVTRMLRQALDDSTRVIYR